MSFDTIITRRGTGSIKWDRRPDLDPYWVADMDFTSPPAVIEALKQRCDHGVFGYAHPHESLEDTVLTYLREQHGAELTAESLEHLGGLVPALSLIARAVGEPGDSLLTCTPVYYPFLHVAKDAGMDTLTVDHIYKDGQWRFDWEALEQTVRPDTKLFILCNPQNPLGRVFEEAEILQLAEFCQRHHLLLVSDEIHCDLILDAKQTPHFSALRLPENYRENLITLMAPSKTYNIAGLGYAYAVIENESLRRRFAVAKGCTLPEINLLAMVGAEAAYKHGESWRQELLLYLRKNRDTVSEFVRTELPGVSTPWNQATYLSLLDCRELDIKQPALHLEKEAGLWLNDGAAFGAPRQVRFNYGCPHARVLEGLEKIKTAFSSYLH